MDLSKTKTNVLSTLSSKKMREKHGIFLAEGSKCVTDTLGAFELDCIAAVPEWIENHPEIVSEWGSKIYTVSPTAMKKISSLSTPPEVVAAFRLPCGEICLEADRNKLYILLDGIQDPGNLGTIVRTADWFGVDTIFASRDTADVFNPKTVQSTMGSLRRVNVIYTDLPALLDRNAGMPVFGMSLEGKNIFTLPLMGMSGFIVMGNEGKGITEIMRKKIDSPLFIPPYNSCSHGESLNVAIATAIALSVFRGRK